MGVRARAVYGAKQLLRDALEYALKSGTRCHFDFVAWMLERTGRGDLADVTRMLKEVPSDAYPHLIAYIDRVISSHRAVDAAAILDIAHRVMLASLRKRAAQPPETN